MATFVKTLKMSGMLFAKTIAHPFTPCIIDRKAGRVILAKSATKAGGVVLAKSSVKCKRS